MSDDRPAVALLGATGLVGGACLRILAASGDFSRVVALTRRSLPEPVAGVEERVIDLERRESYAPDLEVDSVICCLGTTIRRAGSEAAFRRVDHDYPVALATAARERGARHWLLVSSLGANPVARSFYLRVKGEVEAGIERIGFPRVTIVRPSLLAGERAEARLGERIALALSFLFPRRLRPIAATKVAAVLAAEAARLEPGQVVLESEDMQDRVSNLERRPTP